MNERMHEQHNHVQRQTLCRVNKLKDFDGKLSEL